MAKKKACKKCKLFVEGDTCPVCGSTSFTTSWQGRLFVSDVNKSMIGKEVKIEVKGEYAIKVRWMERNKYEDYDSRKKW